MEYGKALVQVGKEWYRVFFHHGASLDVEDLDSFFRSGCRPMILSVSLSDEFSIDDELEVIMIDEAGIYFWCREEVM